METKKYIIRQVSKTLIEEQTWTTIDYEKKYHSFVKLIVQDEEMFCKELVDDYNENDWNLEDYGDIISEQEEELSNYFNKNKIENDGGEETYWELKNDSAYGVNYRRFYHNMIIYADLTEKQVEEIENMDWEVEEDEE